jgi:RNA-directed DNA polymerase
VAFVLPVPAFDAVSQSACPVARIVAQENANFNCSSECTPGRRRQAGHAVGRQFLKAGVLAEEQFLRTDDGPPQGGIVSPLLANIALNAIEERYERWTYQTAKARADHPEYGVIAARRARMWDRTAGRCVSLPIRYADDFVVLASGTQEEALAKRSALAEYLLQTTGLELSPEKTKVTC